MASRVLVVQHQDDCPPGWVGDGLLAAGCVLDVRRPYGGDDLPDDLSAHDALLVLGGSMGAGDDAAHPWLTTTKALVRDAAQRRTPTLGICLGHQLVAVALGGTAGPNPLGQQLGLLTVGWTDAAGSDPLVAGLLGTGSGVHWNDDVVVSAPAGTVVLAQTPAGELQAARFAPAVWGVQLHPEVDDRVLAAWADEDRDRHEAGRVDDVVRRVAAVREELRTGWAPLSEAFAHAAAVAS